MIGMRMCLFVPSNVHQLRLCSQVVVISSVLILIVDELFDLQRLFEIRLIRPDYCSEKKKKKKKQNKTHILYNSLINIRSYLGSRHC